jgi:23S rRNA (cytidine1920-2'-O)/16S rRNA (cytidine1409-2'-O)-methyltransferase
MTKKQRLDRELVRRGLADDVDQAGRLVVAGRVWVQGQRAVKPDEKVSAETRLKLESAPRFVSRGGLKLQGALDHFGLAVTGVRCADVGASTGGFTDCLLQAGASQVYAIDVGRGQLHWKLRQDPRVVVMERTDVRSLEPPTDPVPMLTIDVSFISLEDILPAAVAWLVDEGNLLALVKPQFEATAAEAAGGVVRSQEVRRRVLSQAIGWLAQVECGAVGLVRSSLLGSKGNQEFFLWGVKGSQGTPVAELLDSLD